MNSIINLIKKQYEDNFSGTPLIIRAPGRINLIGEHTDYNNGLVLPAAVSQSIYFAIGKSDNEDECSLISIDLDDRYDFKLSEIEPLVSGSWQNYILGVVAEIQKSGRLVKGFNMVFSGNVPLGAGMSSSAALECGTCFGLSELFDFNITKLEMVKMSQMAEHNYTGVKCGIMDQFASVMGKADHALLLDCQTLDFKYFPIELSDYSLLLCNSNVSHNLASSEYNIRRNQCEEGVRKLKRQYDGINSLRDVTIEQLGVVKNKLDPIVFLRCKYVIEENIRVDNFSNALEQNDLVKVGEILQEAHRAMRYEYEITCPEIDLMADYANNHPDVLGSRMMGGGFGGCTINLIRQGEEDEFVLGLEQAYQKTFSKEITPIKAVISDGVSIIEY